MNYVHRQLVMNAILVAIAVATVVVFGASECANEQTHAAGERLLPDSAAAYRDVVFRKGTRELRFSKQGSMGPWIADEHPEVHGDTAAISKALSALSTMRAIRQLDGSAASDSRERHRLGLEPPAFVWIIGDSQQSWTLKFGDKLPGSDQRTFVAVSTAPQSRTEEIFAVEADLAALDLNPDQLNDAVLLPIRALDIRDVTYSSAQSGFHVRAIQNINWHESEPPGLRVDRERVSELFNELAQLKPATTSHGKEPSDAGALLGELKLAASSGDTTIDFMGACSDHPWLTRTRITNLSVAEYCVETNGLASLLRKGLAPDTRLFTLRVDEVESVKERTHGEVNELRRDGTGFIFQHDSETRFVELEEGNQYVSALLSARGQLASVEQLVTRPRFDSTAYIRLRSSVIGSGDYEETLLLGASDPEGRQLVRRLDDNAILTLDKGTAHLLPTASFRKQRSARVLDAGANQ